MKIFPNYAAINAATGAALSLIGGTYLGVTEGDWMFVPIGAFLLLLAIILERKNARWHNKQQEKQTRTSESE